MLGTPTAVLVASVTSTGAIADFLRNTSTGEVRLDVEKMGFGKRLNAAPSVRDASAPSSSTNGVPRGPRAGSKSRGPSRHSSPPAVTPATKAAAAGNGQGAQGGAAAPAGGVKVAPAAPVAAAVASPAGPAPEGSFQSFPVEMDE